MSSVSTEFTPTDLAMGSVILNDSTVSNLDFHRSGNFLVSTTKENSIHLIDCATGIEKKKIYARALGVGQVKYTHHESCILLSSQQKSNDVRYLCLYDNRYLRSFRHDEPDRISSIAMSPVEDNFLSSSSSMVYMWGLGTTAPIAKLSLPQYSEQVSVAYDGTGLVFGVCCVDGKSKKRSVKLFDARNYQQGPFEDLTPSIERMTTALQGQQQSQTNVLPLQSIQSQAVRILQSSWHGFEFSPDGFHLLVNTSEALIVLDGFKKDAPIVVVPRKGEYSSPLGACFSSDAKYVLCGTDDSDIHIYDKLTGTLKNSLSGGHVAPVGCVRCNPRYDLVASGCVNTALWVRTLKQ